MNIDETINGTVDEESGVVAVVDGASADSYSVVAEIANRVIGAHGRVLAVRRDDMPGGKSLAAILRYPVSS